MEVENLENYFLNEILRRGFDYYKKGKVKEIIKLKGGYLAIVSGTTNYRVMISEHNGTLKMSCTCPYATDNNCKHMAAVLYCFKSGNIPIKKSELKNVVVTDFDVFKKKFRKEYNKLFNHRSYLHENELKEYGDLINQFTSSTKKYIKSNKSLAYKTFEYLLIEVDKIDVYDMYGEKENIFENIFKNFKELLNDPESFNKILNFIMEIYSKSSDLEFYHKENMLNLLYYSIENKWQAEATIEMLKKLENDNNIYNWDKSKFKTTEIYLIYYFISENDGLKIAEDNLNLGKICQFLLNIYQNDEKKQIDILEKAIEQNKKYSNEKYYQQLLVIYKDKNKQKYLEILKEYFVEHKDIKIYRELKKYYNKNEWVKIKEDLLKTITDNEERYWNKNILRDICVEEDDYDALINLLKDEWIGTINNYFKLLAKYRPAQLLVLYKSKIMEEIKWASDRKRYQRIIDYFPNLLSLPNGKKELQKIIKYIKTNYKKRKALQEELEFFEMTYM